MQLGDLARTRRWIADEERSGRAGPVRRVPDWIIERGIAQGSPPTEVHRGDCHATGKRRRPAIQDEAWRALAEGIRACGHWRSGHRSRCAGVTGQTHAGPNRSFISLSTECRVCR
ncbi:DUF6233 domain-containing protein [Streptomyces venezuelae]